MGSLCRTVELCHAGTRACVGRICDAWLRVMLQVKLCYHSPPCSQPLKLTHPRITRTHTHTHACAHTHTHIHTDHCTLLTHEEHTETDEEALGPGRAPRLCHAAGERLLFIVGLFRHAWEQVGMQRVLYSIVGSKTRCKRTLSE